MSVIPSRFAPYLGAVVLAAVPLSASTKTPAAKQEGTLINFADVASGSNCQGECLRGQLPDQDGTPLHCPYRGPAVGSGPRGSAKPTDAA